MVGQGIMVAFGLLLSLQPLCGGGDLLFLLSPPAAAATCFCFNLENPYSDYFQIFAVCILALGNLSGKFFFCVFQFFQQNPRCPTKSYVAL